ncbi:uncharacterized protein LOC130678128 [Microplitis mediator]|uniref:uncharacterized protein LOC130678128 n=1 Tax=Microplitis mediator TaxID=375433 RepID=UPI002553146A|nr:uncharacterized protein LOC130678128 [Microplitis mediator]XP_057341097.1 uncharacterized protein LOC130678128 [Microplitis mediator]
MDKSISENDHDDINVKPKFLDQEAPLLDDNDIAKIIERKTGVSGQSVTNWRLEPITSSYGFLGSYYQLIVTVSKSNASNGESNDIGAKNTEYYFFAKTPPASGPQREVALQIGIFNKEIVMYDDMIPRIGSKRGSNWSPECYFCKRDVIIVMEDLKYQNYTTLGKEVIFDYDILSSLFETFAKFHSRSLIFEEQLRAQGKTLQDVWPDQLNNGLFSSHEKSRLYQKSALMGICCLVKAIDSLTDNQKDMIINKITRWSECLVAAFKPSSKYRNVIAHQDVWTANVMFLMDGQGKPQKCRLIDFQFYGYLNPAMDLMVSFYMTTNRSTRDNFSDTLIQHYYNCVKQCLENESFDIKKILPWNEFRQSCEDARPWGLMTSLINLQLTLLDDHVREKYYVRSPELLENISLGSGRTELVSMQFKTNQLYRERFTENIFEVLEQFSDQVTV